MIADLDAQADAFLDGDLTTGEVQALTAADPTGWAGAVARARARRAALRGLARPGLPDALRERILAAAQPGRAGQPGAPAAETLVAPAPARRPMPWWAYAVPTALAATAALAVLMPHDPPGGGPGARSEAPALAKREVAPGAERKITEVSSTAAAEPMRPAADATAQAAPRAFAPAPAEELAAAGAATDHEVVAMLAERAGLERASALAPAAPAAASVAPGPIGLQLAWVPAPRPGTASARDAGIASTELDAVAAPAPAGAEKTRADQRLAKEAEAVEDADAGRDLLVTLRNETVSDLRIAPGGIRLVGVGRDGGAVWRTTLRAAVETMVPAGRSLSWIQPLAIIPPGVARLRLEVDGQQSTEIAP
jgi:hypothetical protein